MNICVLIPSYNEGKSIGSLVKTIKDRGLDVVVVDDGSLDQTARIAAQAKAEILGHKENKGKGASLQEGFDYILNKDYDAVITMDGDGQHSPEDLPKFINLGASPQIDMIVGNRMSVSKGMPPVRWLTNNFMSVLISIICRRNVPDSQCGFRLIKRRLLQELALASTNYEIESELLIKAYKQGFQVKFIPIQTIYAKEASFINPVVDTMRFFRFILRILCPALFNKKIASR